MKKFNQEIEITINVDVIASQLRSMFKDDSANADIVVEQIIGRACANDITLLGNIMSAMNGFQKEINVKIGDEITLTEPLKVYGFWTKESIERNITCPGNVYDVKVVDINPYANQEVLVEYAVPQRNGSSKTITAWYSASIFS
jgi:hypothetical protein